MELIYSKPKILAESTVMMAECRPNSQPSGRPCNPPAPEGRLYPSIPYQNPIPKKEPKRKIKIININLN